MNFETYYDEYETAIIKAKEKIDATLKADMNPSLPDVTVTLNAIQMNHILNQALKEHAQIQHLKEQIKSL